MTVIKATADVVFELSWEICNKVGGIYTVVQSKASLMRKYYDEYFCIGPYVQSQTRFEFDELEPPEAFRHVFGALADQGIVCHYGKWLIKGEPITILLEFAGLSSKKDVFKARFWERFGVDSLKSGWDFEEPLVWSVACGMLIEKLKEHIFADKKVIAHHHEWLAGLGLLYLKDHAADVKTIFTTHATMLGRSIAGHGEDLYANLDSYDPGAKAAELGVQDKYSTERACAHAADVFTTVSEITSMEAEKLLGKKADVLLYNGFDLETFPTIEETSIKHVFSRDVLREFLSYMFFPYYHNFSLDHNLMMCISGRYEYHNKGMDVFVDALAKVNEELKNQATQRTVTVFFLVPNAATGVRTELLENKNYYRTIKNYVENHTSDIIRKVVHDFITSDDPEEGSDVFTKSFLKSMKQDTMHFKRQGNPPLTTHHLADEAHDPLVQHLYRVGLDNHDDDPVKVVVFPAYMDGDDMLLNMRYYDALAGMHFAVFPSSYEPWGYTPLEAAALGVPTLTTDLAGFGRFVKDKVHKNDPGVFVMDRMGKSYEQSVDDLFGVLWNFVNIDHQERVQNKVHAKQLSKLADWKHMVENYIAAHNLAFEK